MLLNFVNINYNQIIKNPQNIKNIKKNEDKFIKLIQLFYKNDISNLKIKLINKPETQANVSRFQVEHKEVDEQIINHSRLKLFIDLIKDLGYHNIFDTKKHISGEELILNLKILFRTVNYM